MTSTDNNNNANVLAFKAISNFTKDLSEVFGDKHRPLLLYSHLIEKTTFAHDAQIQKHVNAFKLFSNSNREAILTKNLEKLSTKNILFSAKVFIDMEEIFKLAEDDSETKEVIWNHLLTISALVDPQSKAKQILKKQKEEAEKNEDTELSFISDIISKVEGNIETSDNPMEAMNSIMKSDVFGDLIGKMGKGLEDGSLDIGKMIGSVQKMTSELNGGEEMPGGNPMEMISTMMNGMNATGGGTGGNGQMPDISMLAPMMTSMMSNMNLNPQDMPNLDLHQLENKKTE